MPTDPYAATSMHHLVDHLVTDENIDKVAQQLAGANPSGLRRFSSWSMS